MAETAKWYVVHTYSGYENTVKATIEKTVESRSLQDQILAVSIPLETVTEITESGASKTYDRKVYPGYVLVKMVYSDDTWHVIRNVRGVTGFVGTSSNDPTPLTEEEVYAMGVEKKEIIVNYAVGDTVQNRTDKFERGLAGFRRGLAFFVGEQRHIQFRHLGEEIHHARKLAESLGARLQKLAEAVEVELLRVEHLREPRLGHFGVGLRGQAADILGVEPRQLVGVED